MMLILFYCFFISYLIPNAIGQSCMNKGPRYDSISFLNTPGAGDPRYCKLTSNGLSCCSSFTYETIYNNEKTALLNTLKSNLRGLHGFFASRSSTLQDYFQSLLNTSRTELHSTFSSWYGIVYQENAQIFHELFAGLQAYQDGAGISISDVFSQFFGALMSKMFQLMNVEFDLDDRYMDCANQQLLELRPFGTIPTALTEKVRVAFVAARSMGMALRLGREVAADMSKLDVPERCATAVMSLNGCAACAGHSDARPCKALCDNVLSGCLAYYLKIGDIWNTYINSSLVLLSKVTQYQSTRVIQTPMHLEISNGIMEFQENNQKIRDELFKVCGVPRTVGESSIASQPTRTRRDPTLHRIRHQRAISPGANVEQEGMNMLKDLKNKLQKYTGYWPGLLPQLCESMGYQTTLSAPCWTGQAVGRYARPVVPTTFVAQSNNPELPVDSYTAPTINSAVDSLIVRLQVMVDAMGRAVDGQDVNYVDDISGDVGDSDDRLYTDINGLGGSGYGALQPSGVGSGDASWPPDSVGGSGNGDLSHYRPSPTDRLPIDLPGPVDLRRRQPASAAARTVSPLTVAFALFVVTLVRRVAR